MTGLGNVCDYWEDDNDGAADNVDAFPLDSSETLDTDADGVGDNADAFLNDPNETLDTDNDGLAITVILMQMVMVTMISLCRCWLPATMTPASRHLLGYRVLGTVQPHYTGSLISRWYKILLLVRIEHVAIARTDAGTNDVLCWAGGEIEASSVSRIRLGLILA